MARRQEPACSVCGKSIALYHGAVDIEVGVMLGGGGSYAAHSECLKLNQADMNELEWLEKRDAPR